MQISVQNNGTPTSHIFQKSTKKSAQITAHKNYTDKINKQHNHIDTHGIGKHKGTSSKRMEA